MLPKAPEPTWGELSSVMLGIPTEAGAKFGFPAGCALARFRFCGVGGLNCGAGAGVGAA